MESAVKTVRILQIAMLVSIAIYVFIGERIAPGPRSASPVFFYTFSLVGMTLVGIILLVRRTLILQSEATLRTGATDVGTLNRWRSGYIVTYALSESLALFGLILRFMGFNLVQVVPFYLAGFILMFFFGPRQPSGELS